MANRYANLVGSNKIKDEYTKINTGFDAVQAEMDAVNAELDQKADRAFAQVNDLIADTKADTLTIEGGTGIIVTTNPNTKTVNITATGEAIPGPHGSEHLEFGADPIPFATPTEGGLMSAADKQALDKNTLNLAWREVNIRSEGAVGDGVADDYGVIQNALDIAKTGQKVSVIIPPGTYKVTQKLIVYKNTYIKMLPGAVILRAHDGSLMQNGEDGATYYGYDGNGNIIIEGGTLDANLLEYDFECSGISLSHAENIIIRNVTIKDIYAGHAIDLAGCRNVLIENCRFLGYKDRPDQSRNYVEAIQIDIQTAGGFPAFGAHDGTVTQEVTIRNCYFGASGTAGTQAWPCGVGHHGAVHDIWPQKIMILNNVFDGCTYRAIGLYKFKDVLIDGNFFKNCFAVLLITTPTAGTDNTKDINGNQMGVSQAGDNVIFTNNTIEGSYGNVAVVSINGVVGVLTKNVKVVGNTFKGTFISNIPAVYTNYAESVQVKHNKIGDIFRALWTQNSENVVFESNDCDKMTYEMVYMQSTIKSAVRNNKVKETGRIAINIEGMVGGFIQGNYIENSSTEEPGVRPAISIGSSSSGVLVSENKALGTNNSYGLVISSTCSNVQATNNELNGITGRIQNNGAGNGCFDGVFVYSPNGTRYKVTVTDAGSISVTAG